jgi:transcriptional regulator with XRE-family HTH domain
MEIGERFGQNLRAARSAAGLSQEELAFRAEIHRTEVSLIENGGRRPGLETLTKLIGTLGTSADLLLDGILWVPGKSGIGAGNFHISERE